jgi:type II secretory pathway pseudopilin PulG
MAFQLIRRLGGSDEGASLVELLIVLGLLVLLAAMSVPLSASSIDATRARHAAGFMAGAFRAARQQAVMRGSAVGLVFDRSGASWTYRLCVDGNRNGLRRAEIASLIDPCPGAAVRVDQRFAGTAIDVDPSLAGPGGEPGSPDAVRFGSADLVTFSPTGGATAGTLFIRSARNVHYAVRVAGVTGRSRLLFYDAPAAVWRPT